jgi:hypothetical protein
MPRARRSAEQVQAKRAEKASEKIAQAQSHQNTIKKTAQLEAEIHQAHEDKHRRCHNPPTAAVNRAPRQRPPGALRSSGRLSSPEFPEFHSQLIVDLGHTEEGEIPDDDRQPEQDFQSLEEGEIAACVVGGNAPEDDELEACGRNAYEKTKKHKSTSKGKGKSKSKKGELRAQVQSEVQSEVGPPSTPEPSKQKCKAPTEEQ